MLSPVAPPSSRPRSATVFNVFDTVCVLSVPGPRFGGRRAEDFAAAVADTGVAPARLVIDLADVTAVDAVGLRVLAGLAREFRECGSEVAFSTAVRSVRLLLSAAGLHDVAEVYQAREHALDALQVG